MRRSMKETRKITASDKEAWIEAVIREPGLTPGEKNVLVVYSLYINGQTGLAWPSAAHVAKRANVTRRLVGNAMQKGKDLGYLTVVEEGRQTDSGQNLPSKRRLNMSKVVNSGSPDSEQPCTRVVNSGSSGIVNSGSQGSEQSWYLTPERTPEKEPLNKTPDYNPSEGDVGEAVSVVDADEDYFAGLIELSTDHEEGEI